MQYCSKIDAGPPNVWSNATRIFFLTLCDQTGQIALYGRKKGGLCRNVVS
jgi:hypothetical protein